MYSTNKVSSSHVSSFRVFESSIFKFSNFQIFELSGFQIFKFTNFQNFKFSSSEVFKLVGFAPGGLLRHLDSILLQAAIKAAKEGTGGDFNPGLYVSDPADIPLVKEDDGENEGDVEDQVR